MKFSENINEQLDKLLKNKKMVLIVPGIALMLIAAVLLVMAVVGSNRNTDYPDQSQALHDTKESIMGELVKTREYLTQLEGVVNDSWKEIRIEDTETLGGEGSDYFSQYEAWEENFYQLAEHMSELKWLIDESISETVNIMNMIEGNQEYHYEEISEQLLTLDKNLIDIQNYYQATHEELKQLFAAVDATAGEHQQALLATLKKMMTNMEDEVIVAGIEQLNISLYAAAQELQEKSQANFNELQDRLSRQDGSLAESFAQMKERFTKQDDAMADGFEQMHGRISEHDVDIKDNFADMQDKLSAQGGVNESAFANVEERLSLQDNANETAFNNVQERLNKQDSVRESSFESVQEQLMLQDASNADNFGNTQDQIAAHDAAIKNRMDELNTGMASFRQEVENKFINVENIFVSDAANVDDKLAAMDEYMRNTLFQSVSNGKKLLATALLTKGPMVADNATFKEIEAAILAIPQNFEYPDGFVFYDRHMHKNQNGEETTSEQPISGGCYTSAVCHEHAGVDILGTGCYQGDFLGHEHTGSDMQGTGCYQGDYAGHTHSPAAQPTARNATDGCWKGDYTVHVHTGSSSKAGGCYSVKPGSNCGCTSTGRKDVWWDHFGGNVSVCTSCNHPAASHVYSSKKECNSGMKYEASCGGKPLNSRPEANCNNLPLNALPRALNCNNLPLNALPRDLSCGMTTETILRWALGCGMLNEQIIGAHIIYPGHPDYPN